MNKKVKTTCGEFIDSLSPKQKKQYEKEHKEFLISEMLLAAMEGDNVSVRKLAKLAAVQPAVIQGVRSGTKNNVTVKTLQKIMTVLGYSLVFKKDNQVLPLDTTRYK